MLSLSKHCHAEPSNYKLSASDEFAFVCYKVSSPAHLPGENSSKKAMSLPSSASSKSAASFNVVFIQTIYSKFGELSFHDIKGIVIGK
jgi:hypothetical protein